MREPYTPLRPAETAWTTRAGSGGLPAAAPLGARHAALRGGLARVLALVEPPLDEAEREDQQREERDQDEARVRDDLVVRLVVGPLAAVEAAAERRRERGGRGQQQHEAAREQRAEEAAWGRAAHRGPEDNGAADG